MTMIRTIACFAMGMAFLAAGLQGCDEAASLRLLETPVLKMQVPSGWQTAYQPEYSRILSKSPANQCAFAITWREAPGRYDLPSEFGYYFAEWKQRQPAIEASPEATETSIAGYPALRRKVFSRGDEGWSELIVFGVGDRRFSVTVLSDRGDRKAGPLFETIIASLQPVALLPRSSTTNARLATFQDGNVYFQYPGNFQKRGCGPQRGKQSERFPLCVELTESRTDEVIQVRFGEFMPGRDMITDIADGLVWDYILAHSDSPSGFKKEYESPLKTPAACQLGPLRHMLYVGGSYSQNIGEYVLGSSVNVRGRVVNVLDAWGARGRSPEARSLILNSLQLR
jgi:hypothetical protein